MASNASIRHVRAEDTIKVAHGNDVTVTIEFRSAPDEFKTGDYYLDIEPRNTEVKAVSAESPDPAGDVRVLPFDHRPEDRKVQLTKPRRSFPLDITFGTTALQNNSVNLVKVF